MPRTSTLQAPHLVGGYYAQQYDRNPEELSQPSQNVRYEGKIAVTRKGFNDTGWDLNVANTAMKPHHMERFNITFFAGGTAVKYIDHNNSDAVVDTGLTVTAGTVTRMEEYRGMLFLINPTDGLQMILPMKLNGAVTAGNNIVVDIDGAVLLNRFSLTSSTIRVQGISETYTAVNTTNGTLTATSSAGYADNALAIVTNDISSGRPKGSKIVEFKNSLNVIGLGEDQASTSYDTPKHSVAFGDFATASTIEAIIDFSTGKSGSEPVGSWGVLTNAIAMEGYMLLFTETSAYTVATGDVSTTDGSRPPNFYTDEGCLNEDCATEIEGDLVWVSRGRILRARRAVVQNIPVLQLVQMFDAPIKELLDLMDTDQSDALVYYWPTGKLLFVQLSIDGNILTLVYDEDKGIWCPPDTNKHVAGYFEIDGKLYATDANDDTIYQMETGASDNGGDIQCSIASGIFRSGSGVTTMDGGILDFLGEMTRNTTVKYQAKVNGKDGKKKDIDDTLTQFDTGRVIGSALVGSAVIGGGAVPKIFGRFKYKTAVTPAYGEEFQHIWKSQGDGQRFGIKTWRQILSVLDDSLSTIK